MSGITEATIDYLLLDAGPFADIEGTDPLDAALDALTEALNAQVVPT